MGFLKRLQGEEPPIILQVFHSFKGKGAFGEYLADYALDHGDIPGEHETFTNVYVPTRGRTSEVDIVMLHETGVFVFESKNYSGWIFGSANQKQWTQTLEKGRKNRFYNPIFQNRSHINALRDHLGLTDEDFFSFIVFSQRCTLKDVPSDTEDFAIIRRPDLVKSVCKVIDIRKTRFSNEQMQTLSKALRTLAKTEEKAQKHIEDVEATQNKKMCPYCGGELVKRQGKRGEFLGCKNFPKCRYTTSL